MEMKRGRGLNRVVVLPKIFFFKKGPVVRKVSRRWCWLPYIFCGLLNGCESLTNFTIWRGQSCVEFVLIASLIDYRTKERE